MEVKSAEIRNGMLRIQILRNIPEDAKPKIIDIVEVK
jgi:HSP20 family molecular chaperone IbpA